MTRKIYAFGMDGFIVPMMKRFAAEGGLPHFERMLREGAVNQTLPSFPVWTPTNWATLSTGAHTGTHGVTRWRVEVEPGRRIDSFDGRANNAERIWNALERAGMTSVAVHYPAAHPSGVEKGFVVDGFGHPSHRRTDFEVATCQAYTTEAELAAEIEMDHDGTAVRAAQSGVEPIPPLKPAVGWSNLPESHAPPLESRIEVEARLGGDVTAFELLAVDGGGRGYDRVLVCRGRDGARAVAQARVGEWSEWAVEEFAIDGGRQRASVRFKLMELAPDGSRLKLYRTQATYADGFTVPDDLAGELIERFGPYQEHASMLPYTAGMADFDTALEECEYQGLWFAEVARYMLRERGCSFFICHWHLYDYLNHIHLGDVDPVCPGYDADRADEYIDCFRRAYQVGDRILGRLWEDADDRTFVGVLSDHGCSPDVRVANIRQFLHERGFLALTGGQENLVRDQVREEDIDWDRTRAWLKDDKGFDIFINAEPGPEFDRIEAELLLALRTWVDEEVGRNPVAIALPRRDAWLLGQWGGPVRRRGLRLGPRVRERLLRPVAGHRRRRQRGSAQRVRRPPRRVPADPEPGLLQLRLMAAGRPRGEGGVRAAGGQARLHPRRRRGAHLLPPAGRRGPAPVPGHGGAGPVPGVRDGAGAGGPRGWRALNPGRPPGARG